MRVDVNTFLGDYPFRRVPGTSSDALVRTLSRLRIDQAWVSHLPSIYWRDPTEGNAVLYEVVARTPRFRAVPAVHPGLANWEAVLDAAVSHHAAAVRVDPTIQGIDQVGAALRELAAACGARNLPLLLSVRLEDGRQKHPIDASTELAPAAVRHLVRSDAAVRVLVTHADRGFIEEVHWSLTPQESARLWWDISWVWGPPEDHLALLLETIGSERFVLGSGHPLRLAETPLARLDLLELDGAGRAAIEGGNAVALAGR
jgi:hypothetical protein